MRLEAVSTATAARHRRFQAWVTSRLSWSYRVIRILSLSMFLGLLLMASLDGAIEAFALPLALFALLTAYAFAIPSIAAARLFGMIPPDARTERYVFLDESFEVTTGGSPRFFQQTRVRYDGLAMAVEDGDGYYLFTQKNLAYVLWKGDFTEGDPKELGRTLNLALGPKYRWEKRRRSNKGEPR
jgi:hypothetical protein